MQNVSVNRNIYIFVKNTKVEKDKLFAILNEWNYWDKPVPEFHQRELYQSTIDTYLKSGEIIILKGIRRSGKSTLLINHIGHLIQQGKKTSEILFVNFEDPRLDGVISTDILENIFEVYKEYVNNEAIPHVFLDEVQNVYQWERWVLAGYELNRAQFYITGSSSRLLSKEFGTALSGRHLDINVFPLSFREFLLFKGIQTPDRKKMAVEKITYKKAFNEYLKMGGFPKLTTMPDELIKAEIIMYYETIILKDIVARYGLKNYDNVKKVALFLLSNIGKPLNLNKVRVALQLSYELTVNYFEYLKDTYLLMEINQFDFSLKKQFANRRKVYCIDNGILTYTSFRFSEDYGRYLENIVFTELARRGKEIFFFLGKKECDFLIRDGAKIIEAIQVCQTFGDGETKKREMEGLLEAMNTFGLSEGLILTEEEEGEADTESGKILIIPVWKWLLKL